MIFHICFDFSYAAIVEWDELLICESMVSFETETIGISWPNKMHQSLNLKIYQKKHNENNTKCCRLNQHWKLRWRTMQCFVDVEKERNLISKKLKTETSKTIELRPIRIYELFIWQGKNEKLTKRFTHFTHFSEGILNFAAKLRCFRYLLLLFNCIANEVKLLIVCVLCKLQWPQN